MYKCEPLLTLVSSVGILRIQNSGEGQNGKLISAFLMQWVFTEKSCFASNENNIFPWNWVNSVKYTFLLLNFSETLCYRHRDRSELGFVQRNERRVCENTQAMTAALIKMAGPGLCEETKGKQ